MKLQQPGETPRTSLATAISGRLRLPPPLLPRPRSRRIAAALIVVCAIVITVIGVLVHGVARPDSLDRAVRSLVSPQWATSTGHDLRGVAQLGSPVVAGVLTILLSYTYLALRRYTLAVLVPLSALVAGGLTEYVLKPLVGRTSEGLFTYPSGHATVVFALITCVAVLLLAGPDVAAPRALRIVLTITLIAVGCAVCVGLVAAHLHFFTDTIAGAAVGTGVTLALAFAFDSLTRRLGRPAGPASLARRRQPAVPAELADPAQPDAPAGAAPGTGLVARSGG